MSFLLFGDGLPHRSDDADVSAAPAEVPAHVFTDLLIIADEPFGDACQTRHDLSRSEIAALERVVIDERLLQQMQRAVRGGHALDRENLTPVDLARGKLDIRAHIARPGGRCRRRTTPAPPHLRPNSPAALGQSAS